MGNGRGLTQLHLYEASGNWRDSLRPSTGKWSLLWLAPMLGAPPFESPWGGGEATTRNLGRRQDFFAVRSRIVPSSDGSRDARLRFPVGSTNDNCLNARAFRQVDL